MFHMLSCFNLKPGVGIDEFSESLSDLIAFLKADGLVESRSPIGRRCSNTIMDTDDERDQEFFFVLSFRDRAQCDRAVEYFMPRAEPLESIHEAVAGKIADPVFSCWEDIHPGPGGESIG